MLNLETEVFAPAAINETEFRIELAVLLYQKGKFTIGQARKLANLDILAFQEVLASHDVPINYNLSGYQNDLETIQKMNFAHAYHQ